MADNWNRAVALGSAPAALLIGQDDALAPTALGAMHTALSSAADVVVVGAGRTFIDDDGLPLEPKLHVNDRTYVFTGPGPHRLNRHDLSLLSLRNGNALAEPSGMLFRRAAFTAVGGYDPTYLHTADVAFSLALVAHGTAVYLPEPLFQSRRHAGSQTSKNIRSGASSRERVRLIEEFAQPAGLTDEEISRCRSAAFVHSGFDLLRATLRRWPDAARANRGLLRQLVRAGIRPGQVAGVLAEEATSRNADRR
jgi:GT2 family glycosyltransferase